MDKKKLVAGALIGAIAGVVPYRIGKYIKKLKDENELNPAIPHRQGFYEKYIKRPQDFCCALVATIVLSPVMLVTGILVCVKLGSPILFTQERAGLHEKIFKLYKFRTMTDARDANGELLPDEERLTEFGKWLRSTSLDELPELWNILKGDMAVVGPRPLIAQYLPYYTEKERRRHDVRPGLTGWAQVNGRSFLSWEEIFQLDIEYVRNISFLKDVLIVKKTFFKVLQRQDIGDPTQIKKGLDGIAYVEQNGEIKRVHNPLNVERSRNEA